MAAAIHDPSGRPVAAIALALPMHRLTEQLTRRYGKAVAAAAEALSAELAGNVDAPRIPSKPRLESG